jgi:recombination protein RecT
MAQAQAPALQKANTIRAYLEGQKKQLAMAVPKHLPVDRLLRVAMTSIQQTPKLLDCTPVSLLRCVMTCAQLGLEPDQFLGQAYLVPFWNSKKNVMEAQLIPGYRGYISLARRSGEVQSVSAQVVYEKDEFILKYGINEDLTHIPAEGDRGKAKGAYVIFKYKDGGYSFDYMSVGDIDKIRQRSKAKDDGPWVTDYDEMAKKTVIKRHSKLAPLSVEFQKAVALEDRAYTGESQEGIFDNLNGDVIDMETEKDIPALVNKFDEKIAKLESLDIDQLSTFLKKAAETYNMPVEQVKAEAMEDFDSFYKSFENWQRVEKAKEEKGGKVVDADFFDDKKDPIREQYINLRSAGFSTWVHKNLDMIRDLDTPYREEIKAKWEKLYPDDTYPLDIDEVATSGELATPEQQNEPEQETPEPKTIGDRVYDVQCNNPEIAMDYTYREFCETRCQYKDRKDGSVCEDYMNYLKAKGEA